MDREAIRRGAPFFIALLAVLIVDFIVGSLKLTGFNAEFPFFLFGLIAASAYIAVLFYFTLKHYEDARAAQLKAIVLASTITAIVVALAGAIMFFRSTGSSIQTTISIYLLIAIIGAIAGAVVGLIFALNAVLRTDLRITFITTIAFLIFPAVDMLVINQGIEELSGISLFGFFIGTILALIFTKGTMKRGAIIGCIIAAIPMTLDFFGIIAIRPAISNQLWILYILPLLGIVAGYWVERTLVAQKAAQ